MKINKPVRSAVGLAVLSLAATSLAACSSIGGSGSSSGSLTFVTDNADQTVAAAKAVVAAFEKANPKIKVTLETRPQGSDGTTTSRPTWPPATWPMCSSTTTGRCSAPSIRRRIWYPERPVLGFGVGQFVRHVHDRRRKAVRGSLGDGLRRRCSLQHPDLQEARDLGAADVGPDGCGREEDPGGRHRPDNPDLRGGLPRGRLSCSYWATTTTSLRRTRISPLSTRPTRPSTRRPRPRWLASSTFRRCGRTSTRIMRLRH